MRSLEARGYLALFDVRESADKYAINETLARDIVEANEDRRIPIVVSHVDFRVDLTIGHVVKLVVDDKGLFCEAVIDNAAFLETQRAMNEDFVRYFTKVRSSPFLYLRSCLPCFSMSHDRHSLSVKHVALVDVGARRGTLVSYGYIDRPAASQDRYSNRATDFYVVLGCYSRNTLKLANERNDLLFKDALLCGETNTDFISAGLENIISENGRPEGRKTVNTKTMHSPDNVNEAISFISDLASVLSRRGTKRTRESDDGERETKRSRTVDDEPVVNASQVIVERSRGAADVQQDLTNLKDEFKRMQSELLASHSSMMRDLVKMNQEHSAALPPPPIDTKAQPIETTAAQPSSETPVPAADATAGQPPPKSETAESALIEAGVSINESEHLINELFRQFIENTFTVKKSY
jgi:hypothetical protein